MNIGEKIKQLRTEKNLTQPQLAEAIGIEQSYLSKLENDKSVPSADIFQSILKAFAIDVGSFLEGIDEKIIHRQLRQIPEVANYVNAGIAYKIHNIKKWLYGSAAACVIGLTLIVAGYNVLIFSNLKYEYVSYYILQPGETEQMVELWESYEIPIACEIGKVEECNKKQAERADKRKKIAARSIVDTILSPTDQGEYIYKDISGGFRAYKRRGQIISVAPQNGYLIVLGSLLTFGGIFGFFVEFRLRKI